MGIHSLEGTGIEMEDMQVYSEIDEGKRELRIVKDG